MTPRTLLAALLLSFFLTHTAAAETLVSEEIAGNVTWTRDAGPYIVSVARILPGASLTIEPGTVIKVVNNGTPFIVDGGGTLNIGRIDADPVIITSTKDDSVGGDSNHDGTETTPAAGDWRTIIISQGGVVHIANTSLHYGGLSFYSYSQGNMVLLPLVQNNGGILTLDHVTMGDTGYCGVQQNSGTTTVTRSTFVNTSTCGILAAQGYMHVADSTFDTTGRGIFVYGGTIELEGNTFGNLSSYAVSLEGPAINLINHGGNTGVGGILVSQTLTGEAVLPKDGLVYVPALSIPTGASLTIMPGAIIKVPNAWSPFYVNGGTLTVGEAGGEEVIITSIKDDAVGGDTNGDGSTTIPGAADWRSIIVNQGGVVQANNAVITYGGATPYNPWTGGYFTLPVIQNNGGTLALDHVTIAETGYCGVRQELGTTTIINSTFMNVSTCGLFVAQGSVHVASTTFDTTARGITTYGGTLEIGGNTFTNLSSYAVSLEGYSSFINHGGNIGSTGLFISQSISGVQTLPKDGLVYVMGNIGIPEGTSLTILPGAIIKVQSNTGPFYVGGTLNIGEEGGEQVIITSIVDDTVGGDTNGDGADTLPSSQNWRSIVLNSGSSATIKNTTIRYAGASPYNPWTGGADWLPAIRKNGGTLMMDHVTMTDNGNFALLQYAGATTMTNSEIARTSRYGIFLVDGTLSITDSSIHDNVTYGIYNATQQHIDATNNWWGHAGGPTHASNPFGVGDRVSDYVDFGEWLTEEPGGGCLSECYAVLFIPGLAGSKLYRDSDDVWFPDRDQDARELFLSESGVSINSDVTVKAGEVAESAYLLEDVYAGLPELLDTLKSTQVIADWKSTPYDWRLDYDVLLAGGKQTGDRVNYALGTSTPYIIQTLQQLVNKAKTHKVIIVTHSNGGLLAKALVKKLEENNDPLRESIAQVVMVAAPQLGAPKAIASMLHGDENPLSTKHWDIVENDTFRQLVENMPNMYNLLPSDQFVNTVTGPFILFDNPADDPYDRAGRKAILEYGHYDTDQTLNTYRERYPDGISSIAQLYAFITGEGGLRDEPVADDLDTPNVLKEELLLNARNTHAEIDSYLFPSSIKVTQVIGWGLPTITGLEYHRNTDDPDCIEHFPCKVSYRMGRGPITTTDGDGTVPALSASAMSNAASIFVDLKAYNDDIKKKIIIDHSRTHSDIFGSEPVKNILKNLLTEASLGQVPYTSSIKPSGAKYITIEKHSPVDLDLYDNEGNHTGFIDALVNGTLHRTVEEGIPGSSYVIMGSSTYVFFPADTQTTITMHGTATGSATIKITERIDDVVTATTTFFHIPILPTTVGTIALSSLASTSPLVIDNDGNGSAELTLTPVLNGAILADPIIDLIQLTLTPDNKAVILGGPIPPLSATISGFIEGDTIATSMSGTPSCTTTATSDSSVGVYFITCTAGTLSSEKYKVETFATGTIAIIYKWSGFTQPINDTAYNPTQSMSVFKGGSTVPVKFQLKDANGTPVKSSSTPLWLPPQKGSAMSASVDESTYSYPATSGPTFTWDDTAQQYVYNWSTKGLAAGYWYRIYAKLEDGTTQSVVVGLK